MNMVQSQKMAVLLSLLGQPLSCKLKGRPFCRGCRLSLCHGCTASKRCKI